MGQAHSKYAPSIAVKQVQDPAAYIYQGIWTDWTKGSDTWGLTLTLHPDNAVLVTSALAVFVTLAGSQLWTIVRFTLHQTGSRPQPVPSTPNHTKQQVILRNAPTDLATARLMAYDAWISRGRGKGRKLSPRAIWISVVAIVHALLFMVAGTFSNLAISTGSQVDGTAVLSRSSHCGIWNETYFDIVAGGNNPSSSETLDLSTKYIAKQVANVQLSVESRINAKPQDRLDYRRITTCAVLNDTDRVRDWDGEIDVTSDVFERKTAHAYYGPSSYKHTDWTYAYSNFASLYDNFTVQVTTPYQVDAEIYWALSDPAYSTSDFEPIEGLLQSSADVSLFFLSFSGMYLEAIDDPWFSANRLHEVDIPVPLMRRRFARDAAISTMGCTEQHQFCTHDKICTPFGGFDQVQNHQPFVEAMTGHRNATFDRMLRAIAFSSMKEVVEKLSVTNSPLLAVNEIATANTVVSMPLPATQWQRELMYWHSIAMAQVQRNVVQWSSGQIAPDPQFLLPPQEEQDKWFCQNQLIPSTVYQSFSIMSIILILIFGMLIIVVSLNVEALARLLRRCLRRSEPRKDWDNDDMLKLPGKFRDSFWRPRPPPKDKNKSPTTPTTPTSRWGRSPSALAPPSTGLSNDTTAVSWTRCSSPTLPPADRVIPVITISTEASHVDQSSSPYSSRRPHRDSWMAISLNELEAATHSSNSPAQAQPEDRKRLSRTLYEVCHSPSMQRLKNPLNFHVPRPRGSWI
ncbi:uncharacterized protein AB675_3349 [Cyphellophora attinorum]|uniref:Uncharacterized protein n=1 Tax=Cyphellophora attinorum TaxID=1664694 RepID=A0A0N0NLV4_9EURO|nr:uncharacterized protein AB675_3349 [Phialophora attinorum]KPI39618.1 hypothetical protein AB675_3349 [Phialophora attinorum]